MKRRDLYLIAALAAGLAALYFAINQFGGGEIRLGAPAPTAPTASGQAALAPPYVLIQVDGEVRPPVPLTPERDISIEQENGCVNVIHLSAEGVYMAHANCRNQDCIQQGAVTLDNIDSRYLGPRIICLPNKVLIELVAEAP
ncbi:MAG: hypothetical protein GX558_07960 [Clostridiales bacterium]|nr:hypothetical protein [Clostridiales bacterium]